MSSIREANLIGKEQCENFVKDRIENKTVSLYDNIKTNKLPLCSPKIQARSTKAEMKTKLLKADCKFFSSLYVACQVRMGGLKNFFAHGNHAFPVALSEHGKLRKCNKADFLNCLPLPENAMEPPHMDVFVIDGPGLVHANFPEKSMKTFDAYCKE